MGLRKKKKEPLLKGWKAPRMENGKKSKEWGLQKNTQSRKLWTAGTQRKKRENWRKKHGALYGKKAEAVKR